MAHETISDGKTVWINDSSGCCIGRFSRAGIDVHHVGPVQMDIGKQCLDCKAGPTTLKDWKAFQAAMQEHHGIKVSNARMPKFLRPPNKTVATSTHSPTATAKATRKHRRTGHPQA